MNIVTSPIGPTPAEELRDMNVYDVADEINVTILGWVSNCHGIATKVAERYLPNAKVKYGFYLGPISHLSHFAEQPMARHGWIEDNGYIIDPTRWVFEGSAPYIFYAKAESVKNQYDAGMRSVRNSPCDENDALQFIDAYLEGERDFDTKLLHDLGNTFPEDMPGLAGEVYDYVAELGHKAFIPIDFWNEVNDDE